MMLRLRTTLLLSLTLVPVSTINAALIDNGDGTITDTSTNLMWVQDLNLSNTLGADVAINGSDTNGALFWPDAASWAAGLSYAGHSDWRLPSADAVCSGGTTGSEPGMIYNCTGSEMGYLYYNSLGNVAESASVNLGPFLNAPTYPQFWTGTTDSLNSANAWDFHLVGNAFSTVPYGDAGGQHTIPKNDILFGMTNVMLVRSLFAGPTSPSFTPIGDLAGGLAYAFSWRMSNDGTTVVGQSNSGIDEAFYWQEGGGMAGLGTLPAPYDVSSFASDASDNGAVVVGTSEMIPWDTGHAFRWTSGGGMVDLGVLAAPYDVSSEARAVSADGSTVVGISRDAAWNTQAFRWTQAGGTQAVPGMNWALDVSADGSIVAGTDSLGLPSLWTQAGGIQNLSAVDPGDAIAMSPDGSTVVGVDWNTLQAARWTAGSGWQVLGSPVVYQYSQLEGVSSDGSVAVGRATLIDGVTQIALIWDPNNGVRDLKTVMTGEFGIDTSNWTQFFAANGISDSGLIIAGTGERVGGITEPWVFKIPGNTVAAGTNVAVTATPTTSVTFSNVSSAGVVTVGSLNTGPALPTGFNLAGTNQYFNISTTATFSGTAEVCITYNDAGISNEAQLKLMHWDGAVWQNITSTLDTIGNQICGNTTSFSPFVVASESSTAVSLMQFGALPQGNQVILSWTTSSETNNWGFKVLRSESPTGPFLPVSAELIPARGGPGLTMTYSYVDTTAQPDRQYYYQLQDVDHSGLITAHNTISLLPEGTAVAKRDGKTGDQKVQGTAKAKSRPGVGQTAATGVGRGASAQLILPAMQSPQAQATDTEGHAATSTQAPADTTATKVPVVATRHHGETMAVVGDTAARMRDLPEADATPSAAFSVRIQDLKGNEVAVTRDAQAQGQVDPTALSVSIGDGRTAIEWRVAQLAARGFSLLRSERGKDAYVPVIDFVPNYGEADDSATYVYRFVDQNAGSAEYDYRLEVRTWGIQTAAVH